MDEALAVYSALERVTEQMQAYYPTWLANRAVAGVPLPAPSNQDYYSALSRPAIDQIMTNSAVAVFISQAKPSTFIEASTPISSTPGQYGTAQITYVEISVLYRLRNFEPPPLWGKTATTHDIVSLRGLLYAGATMDVVRRLAPGGGVITSVYSKESDFAGAVRFSPDGEPIIGAATTVWGFRQDIDVPYCTLPGSP